MEGGKDSAGSSRRILGIDTSLRSTGYGIVEAEGSILKAGVYGVIRNATTAPLSACLLRLQDQITEIINQHQPGAVAIEGIFYAKNVKTMLVLSHARGVIVAQCARLGLPVYEYEPRRVKMAVVGYGGAQKQQVQKMIKVLLHLEAEPPHDAADALALAITHLHNRTACAALGKAPI